MVAACRPGFIQPLTLPDARALLPDVQTAMADPQDVATRCKMRLLAATLYAVDW